MSHRPGLCDVDGILPPQNNPNKPYHETDRDAVIMSIADGQHGVVARKQLVEAGVPVHAIDYRVKRNRLNLLFRGVYRLGASKAQHQKETAALLACGEAAVLSHRSAAGLWKMVRRPPDGDQVDVTLRWGCRRPSPSVRVYRFARLEPDETTHLEGIPVTVPARTLLDLSGSWDPRRVEQALALALREHLTDEEEIRRLLRRYPRRPGTPLLRDLLARDHGPVFTRSEAESRFLELVRRARLPKPKVNVLVEGYEVDMLWEKECLIVEIDGFAFHSSFSAFERDRRRDALLIGAGFRVVRVTWRQLAEEPEALLVRLVRALARATP